jgi:hypothetical protein
VPLTSRARTRAAQSAIPFERDLAAIVPSDRVPEIPGLLEALVREGLVTRVESAYRLS